MWQTPRFFDLAEPHKHPIIFLGNRIPFRYTAKLDHVSMGAMKYEKRIRSVRPAPMLAEVTQLFGIWGRCPNLVIGDIRGVVHHVWDVRGSYVLIFIRIHVGPEDWRQHVCDTGSFRRFVIAYLVTFLDDFLQFFRRSSLRLHLRGIKEDPHLCLGARFIKGNRVENIVSILPQGPSPPERIIAGSSNKGVESIRAFTGDFKALVRV